MPKLDQLATILLSVAATVIAGSVLKRDVFSRRAQPEGTSLLVKQIDDFERLLEAGTRIGSARAQVVIAEFADFQCPFCAQFHGTLGQLKRRFADSVSLVVLHYPLRSHPHARDAARAVECAGRQQRFEPFADALYERQSSIGVQPWAEFAINAGVPDLTVFDTCVRDTAAVPKIDRGLELGKLVGVRGTPTVLVNGWLFRRPPTEAELVDVVSSLLAGKLPPGT